LRSFSSLDSKVVVPLRYDDAAPFGSKAPQFVIVGFTIHRRVAQQKVRYQGTLSVLGRI
jgi:hypothetical protein